MTSDTKDSLVLVTGASGFVAMHCILQLLEAGYSVRGTVRNPQRTTQVEAALKAHGADTSRLSFVVADLTSDAGWSEAMRSVTYVLHVASPLPRTPPKHADELIVPARDGALRVIRAAQRAQVKRLVMTSSVAAVLYGHKRDGSETYDESHWSVLSKDVGAYEQSKTIAERAAWDLVASFPEEERLEFCTINPGLVLGPVLDSDYGTSGEVVRKLMAREMPGCPDIGWAMVDVRDVASAHLAAMITEGAAGKRFVASVQHASMLDVARILERHFSGRGFRIPTRRVPGWLLRGVALFDKTAALAVQELGKRQDLDTTQIETVLGWHPRGLEEMVVSMGESLIEHGIVTA
ncbi:MAG: aldehyde reductase [Myxococcales bacterium]|nr:aldehyde reductase [Myxococcales bacterium]